MKEKTPHKVYTCKHCQQTFGSVASLASHVRHNHTRTDTVECECEFCHKKFTHSGLKCHLKHCYNNPEREETDYQRSSRLKKEQRVKGEALPGVCQFCGKECHNQNSLRQHQVRCRNNPNRTAHVFTKEELYRIHEQHRGMLGWNKGLTKETDERLRKCAEKLSQKYRTGELTPTFKGKHHTKETKLRMAQNARQKKFIDHFGFHKTYEYQGLKFHSSYELQLAKELDNKGVKWQQPKYATFLYVDLAGKQHSYTPDFYLPEYDVYLDPKNDFLIEHINPALGYCDMDKIRWVMEQNPGVKVLVLREEQLTWEVIKDLLESWQSQV